MLDDKSKKDLVILLKKADRISIQSDFLIEKGNSYLKEGYLLRKKAKKIRKKIDCLMVKL